MSAVLMILGFLLLAMVSASLAALFVREEEPRESRKEAAGAAILTALNRLEKRLADMERRLDAAQVADASRSSETGDEHGSAAPEP